MFNLNHMQNQNIQKFLESVPVEAGEILLKYFRKEFHHTQKPDFKGPVTEADLASEAHIRKRIREEFPQTGIMGEEEGSENLESEYLWVLDPLDGTKNFMHGNSYFCVSIALCENRRNNRGENHSCQPIAGAIYHPVEKDFYFAQKGQGAFVNGAPINVFARESFSENTFATGLSSNTGEDLKKVFETMREVQNRCNGSAVRLNGAAALDMALTSRGVINGFWEKKLSPWDMAAGAILIREAGGVAWNFLGQDYDVLRDKDVICGAQTLVLPLLDMIKSNKL